MQIQALDLQPLLDRFKAAFKGKKAVVIRPLTTSVQVIHYATVICEVTQHGEITLDNGGYLTATTKRHLNTCLVVLNKKDYIGQKKFTWYLNGTDTEFTRNFKMTTY